MAINTTVENINNQPTIQPRTVTGIFTKYLAKTLPLAFDESMSYYECLCALLEYLNETIVPDINNTNDGLSELQEFYLDLQNYVNEYFDNLDVQEEINNKLDDMSESGELTELIKNYVDPIQQAFESTVNAQINNQNNALVGQNNRINVLSSRIDSFTNLTDGSTTGDAELIDGRTDYKGVTYNNIGDCIRYEGTQLSNILYNGIISYTVPRASMKQGSLGNNGHYNSSTTRIYSDIFFKAESNITFIIPEGFKLAIYWYSSPSEDDYVTLRNWYTGTRVQTKENNYFRITYAKDTDASITPSDYTSNLTFTMTSQSQIHENKNSINYLKPLVEQNEKSLTNMYLLLKNKGYYYYADTGTLGTSLSLDASDLIPVKTGEKIKYSLVGTNSASGLICLFNTDKSYNSTIARGVNSSTRITGEYTFLADGYIGVSNRQDDYTDAYLYFTNTIPDIIKQELKIELDDEIPDYWKSTLNDDIDSIIDNNDNMGANGVTFTYLTDVHWSSNAKNSPKLINKIREKTNATTIFYGGDTLDLHSTKTDAVSITNNFMTSFNKDTKLFSSLGNHDWNDNVSSTYPDAHLNNNDVYNLYVRRTEDYINTDKKLYYYYDNPSQKFRFIVLNNGKYVDSTQTNWLINTISELDNTWTVVIFMHRYYNPQPAETELSTVDTYAQTIINTLATNRSNFNADIACIIAGHCHRDYNTIDNGFLIIGVQTDCYSESTYWGGETMTLGTNTEQAFDVFTIDNYNRKIKTVRIGAGSDREFDY